MAGFADDGAHTDRVLAPTGWASQISIVVLVKGAEGEVRHVQPTMMKSHVWLMGSSHTVLRSALPRSVNQQSSLVNGAVSQWETIPPGEGSLQPVAIVSTRGDDGKKALLVEPTP